MGLRLYGIKCQEKLLVWICATIIYSLTFETVRQVVGQERQSLQLSMDVSDVHIAAYANKSGPSRG